MLGVESRNEFPKRQKDQEEDREVFSLCNRTVQSRIPLFRIRDIFLRIRMRTWILKSVPLTNGCGFGSGSVSCSFLQWTSRRQKFFLFLCLFLFEGTFTSFFKKSQNSRKQKSRFFFNFLLVDGSIRIRIRTYGSGSRRPKTIRIRNTAEYCVSNATKLI